MRVGRNGPARFQDIPAPSKIRAGDPILGRHEAPGADPLPLPRRGARPAGRGGGAGARRGPAGDRVRRLPRPELRPLPAGGLRPGAAVADPLRLRPARPRRPGGRALPSRRRAPRLDHRLLEQLAQRHRRLRPQHAGDAGAVGRHPPAAGDRSAPRARHRLLGRRAGGLSPGVPAARRSGGSDRRRRRAAAQPAAGRAPSLRVLRARRRGRLQLPRAARSRAEARRVRRRGRSPRPGELRRRARVGAAGAAGGRRRVARHAGHAPRRARARRESTSRRAGRRISSGRAPWRRRATRSGRRRALRWASPSSRA